MIKARLSSSLKSTVWLKKSRVMLCPQQPPFITFLFSYCAPDATAIWCLKPTSLLLDSRPAACYALCLDHRISRVHPMAQLTGPKWHQ